MDPVVRSILAIQEECSQVLRELFKVLHQERLALVRLQIGEIADTTLMKETLNLQLIEKSKILKHQVEFNFTTLNDFEEKLAKSDLEKWIALREEFWKLHGELKQACEINQGFLKSSLRNLGTLTDHLRRLFGERPLYSPKGTKIDRASQGRVLEASY